MNAPKAYPPSLAPLEVACPAEAVIGFPLHVGVTLRSDPPGATLHRLPLCDDAWHGGALGLQVIDEAGRTAEREARPPAHGPVFSLAGGRSHRMLVDLSDLLPHDLRDGRYRLRVCYASPAGRAFGEVLSVMLRCPAAAEEVRLRLLEPAVRRAGSWGRWARLPPEAGEPPQPPLTADDPLRYPRFLRELLFRSDPPTRRDLALLDRLDVPGDVYAPEIAAWRAELLQLLGDNEGFDAQAAVVSREHPGLAWWMERLRRGLGTLAWQRSSRREAPTA